MAGTIQHRKITAAALKLVPEFPGSRDRLAEEFCLYPDWAFTDPEKFARYCRLPSGEWFHYLPDISYAELYRYHTIDNSGYIRRARPFRIRASAKQFRNGERKTPLRIYHNNTLIYHEKILVFSKGGLHSSLSGRTPQGGMMDEYMEKALDIVKAQAAVRPMTEEEILAQIRRLSSLLRGMKQKEETPPVPKKTRRSIREQRILCLECGRSFRMLTSRHLATHRLTPDEYRDKWGLKKDTPLLCRALQKARRTTMHSMRLWERRSSAEKGDAVPDLPACTGA